MGRPKQPRRPALNLAQLAHLEDWCTGITENAALAGNPDPSMVVRCATMRALIQQARHGIGFATIQMQSPAVRSAQAKKAADVRWARVRARKWAALAEMQTQEVKKMAES